MRVVYKYPIGHGVTRLTIPQKFLPLHFDWQEQLVESLHGEVFQRGFMLWCQVDTEEPDREYSFEVYATGVPIDDGDIYIGTCLQQGGEYIWHLYAKPLSRQENA